MPVSSIDTALVQEYKAGIEISFQQMGSRLRRTVDEETQNAEYAYYDRISATSTREITTRHEDTVLQETTHTRRRIGLRDFNWAQLIDNRDKLRMLSDPTSPYTQNAIMAFNRNVDDVIIGAALGTAYSGKTGSTTVAYDTAYQIAVDYVESGSADNSNMTIGKLRQARQLLDNNEAVNDGEPLYCIMSAKQMQSLLRTTEVTSLDYNTVAALVDGKVNTFLGMEFIRSNRLTYSSGVIRSCLVYPKSAIKLGVAQNVMVDIGPRRDKNNAIQIYVEMNFNATRMYEEKVIQILCDESVI